MKNLKPEKLVEVEVLAWCNQNAWSVDVYDSKATYSEKSKSYKKSKSLKQGTPDIVGNCQNGLACYIELKAPGIYYCSQEQYLFLKRKIESNAFGCVVRSAKELEEYYLSYKNASDSKSYLLSILPKKIKVNGKIINVF